MTRKSYLASTRLVEKGGIEPITRIDFKINWLKTDGDVGNHAIFDVVIAIDVTQSETEDGRRADGRGG